MSRILSQFSNIGPSGNMICTDNIISNILKFIDEQSFLIEEQRYKIVRHGLNKETLQKNRNEFFRSIGVEIYDNVTNDKTSQTNKVQNTSNNTNKANDINTDFFLEKTQLQQAVQESIETNDIEEIKKKSLNELSPDEQAMRVVTEDINQENLDKGIQRSIESKPSNPPPTYQK